MRVHTHTHTHTPQHTQTHRRMRAVSFFLFFFASRDWVQLCAGWQWRLMEQRNLLEISPSFSLTLSSSSTTVITILSASVCFITSLTRRTHLGKQHSFKTKWGLVLFPLNIWLVLLQRCCAVYSSWKSATSPSAKTGALLISADVLH